MKTTHLLFDQAPLLVRPELAVIVGLNEAIVLQQIHYWIEAKKKSVKEKELTQERTYKEGRFWTYNSYTEWQEQFPFWSIDTIKRVFKNLEKKEILLVGVFNKLRMDRTKWYTIDYEKLDNLTKKNVEATHEGKMQQCETTHEGILPSPIGHFAPLQEGILPPPIPKSTSKNSTKNTLKKIDDKETPLKDEQPKVEIENFEDAFNEVLSKVSQKHNFSLSKVTINSLKKRIEKKYVADEIYTEFYGYVESSILNAHNTYLKNRKERESRRRMQKAVEEGKKRKLEEGRKPVSIDTYNWLDEDGGKLL